MNVMILPTIDDFRELSRDAVARQHFIACADGPGHFQVIKDRINGTPKGTRIKATTHHWFLREPA
jgi:hypothetical protein